MQNPTAARTETMRNTEGMEPHKDLSEPSSENANSIEKSAKADEGRSHRKPSVKRKLEEIKRERSERAKVRPQAPEIAKGSKGSKPKER
jgi:hypothetical protein